MSTLPASNLPPIDQALVPASVRNGDPAAQQAYQAGLGFEQILVQQLAQEMASTATGSSDGSGADGTDGSTDGTDGTSGLMGSDPANSMYAQLLPTALSSGIMSAGGMGIAQQLALGLDPTLLSPPASGTSSGTSTTTSSSGGVAPSPSGGAA
jgi:Rod binding domain-containing protein